MTPFLFAALFLLLAGFLFLKTTRRLLTQIKVRRSLKRALRQNRKEIKRHKDDPPRLLEVYKVVYNTALFESRPIKRFTSEAKREQYVSDELNKLIKHPLSSPLSPLVILVKGGTAAFLLLLTFSFLPIAIDEFKTSPFAKLEKKIDAYLATAGSPEGRTFDFKEDKTAVSPLYQQSNGAYPAHVMNAKQLAQATAYHMKGFEPRFSITYQGNPQDFEQTVKRAFSWIEKHETYTARTMKQYAYQYVDYGTHVEYTVTMKYHLSKQENALARGKVKQIARAMPKGLSDYEKVKYVNDYIVYHTQYELKSKASPYTPYSILLNGEGVCEGYALSTLLLLKELGIETKYISGTAGGELHAWNLVKLDGKWYHLDTTWNDPVPDRGETIGYDYFLISDKQMQKDHKWKHQNFPKTAEQRYL